MSFVVSLIVVPNDDSVDYFSITLALESISRESALLDSSTDRRSCCPGIVIGLFFTRKEMCIRTYYSTFVADLAKFAVNKGLASSPSMWTPALLRCSTFVRDTKPFQNKFCRIHLSNTTIVCIFTLCSQPIDGHNAKTFAAYLSTASS